MDFKMRKNFFLTGCLAFCLGTFLTACTDDDETDGQGGDTPVEKADDTPAPQRAAAGFYIANEDWMGHDNGSVNYFRQGADGYSVSYRAFRAANDGKQLGVTTCFATVWENSVYFVSKQGNRLVVADAVTLKEQATIEDLGGGDGRMFLGLDDKKAYVSTTQGIVKFDLAARKVAGAVEGVEGQVGNMAQAGGKVFAVSKSRLFIIDADTDRLLKTVDGSFATAVASKDGAVWVAAKDAFLKFDTATLEAETVPYPDGGKVYDAWFAWNAGTLCASVQENVLYWASGSSSWSVNELWKYDIDTARAEKICQPGQTPHGKNYLLYGAGLRVDPVSDELAVTLIQDGFGDNYAYNWVWKLDKDGARLAEITLQGDNGTSGVEDGRYYWFPAMPFYEDANQPQLLLNQVMLRPGATVSVDLKEKVVDYDNTFASMKWELTPPEAPLAEVSVEEGALRVKAGAQTGVTSCRLAVISNGVRVWKTVEIAVVE